MSVRLASAGGAAALERPEPARVAPSGHPYVVHARFAHFDDYAHRAYPPGFEVTLTGPESGPWRSSHVKLVRSAVGFGSEGGPNVGHVAIPASTVVLHVSLDGPAPRCLGAPLLRDRVAVYGPGADQIEAVRGPSRWATFSVDADVLREALAELGAADGACVAPGEARLVTLSRVHARHVRAALDDVSARMTTSPASFRDGAVRAAWERRLVMCFATALASAQCIERRTAGPVEQHRRLLLGAMRYLGAEPFGDVKVHEVCAALAISQRTLTRVFREEFDISPARYLKLRRMNQARARLRRGEPAPATVTEVAMQFEFYELGRFAVEYRRLFGERPSDTLSYRTAM